MSTEPELELEQLRTEIAKLRVYIDSDAHHHMSTVAGLLRVWADSKLAAAAPQRLVDAADRLALSCRHAREVLGVCPSCGGAQMTGADPCPECAVPKEARLS